MCIPSKQEHPGLKPRGLVLSPLRGMQDFGSPSFYGPDSGFGAPGSSPEPPSGLCSVSGGSTGVNSGLGVAGGGSVGPDSGLC